MYIFEHSYIFGNILRIIYGMLANAWIRMRLWLNISTELSKLYDFSQYTAKTEKRCMGKGAVVKFRRNGAERRSATSV